MCLKHASQGILRQVIHKATLGGEHPAASCVLHALATPHFLSSPPPLLISWSWAGKPKCCTSPMTPGALNQPALTAKFALPLVPTVQL